MGERISYVPSKVSVELSKYMQTALDEDWRLNRGGMEIVSVAVASISYTDDSTKLINMRNEGAMLSRSRCSRRLYVRCSLRLVVYGGCW